MTKKKWFIGVSSLLTLVIIILACSFYSRVYGSNTTKKGFVYLSTNSSFDSVVKQLSPFLNNVSSFKWLAKKKNYPNTIKAGRYLIKAGISNNDLINTLRSGEQTPINITFNNQDSLEKLAGRIAQQIEPDSTTLLKVMTDSLFLKEHQFDQKNALGMYIPNSYEFYWNTSAENFRTRMFQEYRRFWNQNRLQLAAELKLSPKEVTILASIVQKETAQNSERPIIAGLYINRLKKRWPLQADPTIIFALKEKYGDDFVVKRVLTKDLQIQSPYNTYLNRGLPPSLIAMPDISSIDAVLHYTRHRYYYMCASTERIGFHEFSTSLSKHNSNAAKYQRWINKQRINR